LGERESGGRDSWGGAWKRVGGGGRWRVGLGSAVGVWADLLVVEAGGMVLRSMAISWA